MAKTIEPESRWIEKRDSNNLFTVGRLKPGVSFTEAKAGLETPTAQLAKDYPENAGRGIRPAWCDANDSFNLDIRCATVGHPYSAPTGRAREN